MAKEYEGVRDASESSIEIDFYYKGIRCRERIKLPPTPKHKAYAANLKATIQHEIAKNEFDYGKHFPDSPRARKLSKVPGNAIAVDAYFTQWLESEKEAIRHSTWLGYSKIFRYHLSPEFGKLSLAELDGGHTDPAFTLKTYIKVIPSDVPDAGNKAVERWGTHSEMGE